jgi:hypothetical protein
LSTGEEPIYLTEMIAVKEVLETATGNAAAREIDQLERIGANVSPIS